MERKMKKILYTATVASHICQFHLPYFKRFREMGYEVHVAAHDNLGEKNGLALRDVDKFFEIPFRRSPLSPKNIGAMRKLRAIINREGYDIIVCNTPVGGIMTRIAAKRARRSGVRVIYIAHGFHFYKGASKKNWLLYYPIEKHFAKRCDALVTINHEDYLFAKDKFKTNVYRIHGIGVDPERYRQFDDEERRIVRGEVGLSDGDFVCLCVGELNSNKDQITAIKAAETVLAKHPNVKLLLAGNGPEEERLSSYIKDHGLEGSVRLLGYCTDLERYQGVSDVGISCSIREGLGLNVIEAMLASNVFIGAKNRGHIELIKNGENGFLVEPRDSASMARVLDRLINEPSLYDEISKRASRSVQQYTVSETVREFEEILNSTVN